MKISHYRLLYSVAANATCSSQCGTYGCWGPGEDQCVRCPVYRRNDTRVCLASCDEQPRLYADDSAPQKQCRLCHTQCLNSCTGPVRTPLILLSVVKSTFVPFDAWDDQIWHDNPPCGRKKGSKGVHHPPCVVVPLGRSRKTPTERM